MTAFPAGPETGPTRWGGLSHSLDRVYPVIFIDAIVVKIRDGQVANRPVYAAIGVTVEGQRDILGLWIASRVVV